jgi:uncharacterized membrane protein
MTRWFIGTLLLTMASWVGWTWLYLRPDYFPERVPIHWNIRMEPDGWADGASAALWMLFPPITMTFLVLLGWAVPRFAAGTFADEKTRRALDFILFGVCLFFGFIGCVLVHGMRTNELAGTWFIGSFFVLFPILGLAMRDLPRNGFVGVRTPWTLNNDQVWARTHRMTAWLWCAAGVVGMALVVGDAPFWTPLLVLFGAIFYPIWYSFRIR